MRMELVEIKTGKKVEAYIKRLTFLEIRRLKNNHRFLFDWSLEIDYEVYQISLKGEVEILGLISISDISRELRIHINLIESSIENKGNKKQFDYIPGCLIGFACQLAFLKGYGGFVSLKAKTQLIDHYRKKYDFISIGAQMAIYGKFAQELIKKYLGHEEI